MIYAFDFDGTLVDTMPALARHGIRILESTYGLDYNDASTCYWGSIGISFAEQLEELFPGDEKNEEAETEFWYAHLETYKKVTEAMPGAKAALQSLIDRGSICWVVTSSPAALVSAVCARVLPSELKVLGRSVGPKDKQLRLCSADVFFGDAVRDTLFARKANVRFIGIGDVPKFYGMGQEAATTLVEGLNLAMQEAVA